MQFTSCNVLLACGVAHRVGSFGRSGQLLASSALVFSVDHPFCYGSRLRGQLAKNRSFHCAVTGPLFLVAASLFLLAEVNMMRVNYSLVWTFVLLGTAIAFLPEWGYAKRFN